MAKYKKRADGRYAKQVTIGMKNKKAWKKTVYGRTIAELEANYREMMLLVDKGIFLDNQGIAMRELLKDWYRIRKEGKISKNTAISYNTVFNRINDVIGDIKVKDVTRYTIEVLTSNIEREGFKRLALLVLKTVNAVFEYAIQNDIVAKNPTQGLSIVYKPSEKRAFTEEEKKNIDSAKGLTEREKAYLLILRYTGMRKGEVLALMKSDINFQNSTINVNKTLIDNEGKPEIQDMTKTPAGMRIVPLFLPLHLPLQKYVDSLESEYLFTTRSGKFISANGTTQLMKQIKKKVGLGSDLTTHCFRHNFISECYKAGIDIKKLQKWVGHVDISTTLNIYTHLSAAEVLYGQEMNDYYGSQTEVKPKSEVFPEPLSLVK